MPERSRNVFRTFTGWHGRIYTLASIRLASLCHLYARLMKCSGLLMRLPRIIWHTLGPFGDDTALRCGMKHVLSYGMTVLIIAARYYSSALS